MASIDGSAGTNRSADTSAHTNAHDNTSSTSDASSPDRAPSDVAVADKPTTEAPPNTKERPVKHGDTVRSIAEEEKITVQNLYELNPNIDPAKRNVPMDQMQSHWDPEYLQGTPSVNVPDVVLAQAEGETITQQQFDGLPTANPLEVSLSHYQAVETINELPVPSLNDPAATRAHQQQRADIADGALADAVPPTRADFESLPPRLAEMEFSDALSSYNNNVQTLKDISEATHASLNASSTAVLDDSAARVWEAAESHPYTGAQVLAEEIENLNATYGPDAGSQLVEKLYQDSKGGSYEHDLNNVLSFAGGEEIGGVGLPESQRNSIGTAIGQAYGAMSPTDRTEFVEGLVAETEADAFRSSSLGYDTTRVADLVSRSDSEALKTDAVNALTKRMVEIQPGLFGNNSGVDIKALANSAAIIADSGAPGAEQAAMFNTIITSFPKMGSTQLASLTEDPDFKDRLSELFIQNGKGVLATQAPDGAFANGDFIEGMTKFFEMTLFSENGGKLRSELMQSVVETMKDVGDAFKSPPMGEADYANSHNGWSQFDHVEVMGGLMGMVWQAASNQKDAIQSDITQRQETAALFLGMAFSFVPGADDVIGKIAGEGASFLEKLPDTLIDTGWNRGTDILSDASQDALFGAISGLNGKDALGSIDELLEQFGNVVIATNAALPNGEEGELNLRSAFQSAFSFYNLVKF